MKKSRRQFLQLSAAAVTTSNLSTACSSNQKHIQISEAQKTQKPKGRSKVFIAKSENYQEKNLVDILSKGLTETGPEIKNKTIFLKINLVSYSPEHPLVTDPRFVSCLIQTLKNFGAKEIRIGDGPALTRDTDYVLELTGMKEVCQKHQIQFVDLNLDDVVERKNILKFTNIDSFLLPKALISSDLIISVPKLKTHHWALMTASMKNLFGALPGSKYGWPKNLLHVQGINESIIDIASSLKADYAIVDAIIAMEGDGPIHGSAKNMNTIFCGKDLAAVDSICARAMSLPVEAIPYLQLAEQVFGNTKLEKIDIIGEKLENVLQKFELPPTFGTNGQIKNLPGLTASMESGST